MKKMSVVRQLYYKRHNDPSDEPEGKMLLLPCSIFLTDRIILAKVLALTLLTSLLVFYLVNTINLADVSSPDLPIATATTRGAPPPVVGLSVTKLDTQLVETNS
ncbi:MAG: hypothetical protein IH612_18445 [Desulfofustis sp.]|nr:hypothetical protein [Desulfofustis sp.]